MSVEDLTGTQKDKKAKEQTRRELLAKYLYDISKVFVAGMFILNIIPVLQGDTSTQNLLSLATGALASIGLAWVANRILIY